MLLYRQVTTAALINNIDKIKRPSCLWETHTLGKYIFFQHLSQSVLPPSMGIHRPSSTGLLQLAHCFTLRDLFEEVDKLFVTLFDGFKTSFKASNSLGLARVGLVCERVGSLGGLLELSLTGLWFSTPAGRMCVVGERGEKLALVVGDRGLSSNRVSIALSRAPVDLAMLLAPFTEYEDEAVEGLRIGIRAEYTDSDDLEDREEGVGNLIPSFFDRSFPSS